MICDAVCPGQRRGACLDPGRGASFGARSRQLIRGSVSDHPPTRRTVGADGYRRGRDATRAARPRGLLMSPVLVSVLVSAGVSVVVTLGIEYFAKPRLEVRRDRILEKHRRRRAVMTHWRALERGLRRLIERVRQEKPCRHDDDDLHASISEHVGGLKATIAVSDDELKNLETTDMLAVAEAWDEYESVRAGVGRRTNYELDQLVKVEVQPLSERTFELIAVPRWRGRRRRQVRAQALYYED